MNSRVQQGLLWVLALMAPVSGAQQGVSVDVSLSRPLVKLGDELHLRIHVDGTRDARVVQPPSVEGLIFGSLAGPQISQMQEFQGGRVTSRISVEWAMSIRPTRVGEFEIPPISLEVDGKTVRAPAQAMSLRVIQDLEGATHCFIESMDVPTRVFEGEPFDLDLRFGTDLAAGEVDLYLPWWPSHRGVLEVKTGNPRGTYRFPVNDRHEASVTELDPAQRNGVPFRVFQLARRYLATRPGTLEFNAATFQFSEVIRRSTVFATGRYKRYHAQSEPFQIEVLPVPEEGRPLDWTGAVGELTTQRRVDRRDVDEGGTISLTVSWFGRGNTEFFAAPDLKRLSGFEDFRVLGVEDSHFSDERRVTYDLVPTSSKITEIPPVPMWVFSPVSETFVRVATDPVAVRVRSVGDPEGGMPLAGDELDLFDVHPDPISETGLAPLGAGRLGGAAVSILGLWFLGRTLIRRHQGDPNAPRARRRRAALRRLRTALKVSDSASEQSLALARFMGDRMGEPAGAWLGRDVVEWSESMGAPLEESLLRDWSAICADLDASAWSDADQPIDGSRMVNLAQALCAKGL
ncbi:MAG: hypothetical protein CMJ98_11435 [Planctomycetes bacterium]|nr:hypothetical protein [Planctomycetota bacterium]HJM56920.1 BatD family protein [Planctomycetota bacterium]